ncbi:MAG: ShlB/FhaC/HecB family hemolysin secretion/activation protein [Sphingobium sp.]
MRMFAFLLIVAFQADGVSADAPVRPLDAASRNASKTRIDGVRFVGAAQIPAADLTKEVAPWLHRDLSFDQMHEMAGAVTSLYRRRGYMVASAHLAAQTIRDNVLTITVAEGKLGDVRLRTNSSRVSDEQILETLSLNLCGRATSCAGDPIHSADVERAGLLVSEIPGVKAQYELAAGQSPGTTDLLLDAIPTKRFNATVGADNNGFALTGRNRGSLALSASNLLNIGDFYSLSATYTGKGFFGFAFDGSAPLGNHGWRGGVTAGHVRYALGREFAILGATGVSDNAGVYASYPVVRTLATRLELRLDLIAKEIRSDIVTLSLRSRQRAQEGVLSISGSHVDKLFRLGSSQVRLAFTGGELQLRDPASRAFDAATARTDGSFGKFSYLVRREELLAPGWTAFVQLSGQYAVTNLDSSEKFALGGAQAVRAYATGAAAADSAALLTVETRFRVPERLSGRWELMAAPFYDHAWATFNKQVWAGYVGPNKGQMAGAGVYASLADPGRYSLRFTYANRQSTSRDVVPGSEDRVWLEAAAVF